MRFKFGLAFSKRRVLISVAVLLLVGIGLSSTTYLKNKADLVGQNSDPTAYLRGYLNSQNIGISASLVGATGNRNFTANIIKSKNGVLQGSIDAYDESICVPIYGQIKKSDISDMIVGDSKEYANDSSGISCKLSIYKGGLGTNVPLTVTKTLNLYGGSMATNPAFNSVKELYSANVATLSETLKIDPWLKAENVENINWDGTGTIPLVNKFVDTCTISGSLDIQESQTTQAIENGDIGSYNNTEVTLNAEKMIYNVTTDLNYTLYIKYKKYLLNQSSQLDPAIPNDTKGIVNVFNVEVCKPACKTTIEEVRNASGTIHRIVGSSSGNYYDGTLSSITTRDVNITGSMSYLGETDSLRWNDDLRIQQNDKVEIYNDITLYESKTGQYGSDTKLSSFSFQNRKTAKFDSSVNMDRNISTDNEDSIISKTTFYSNNEDVREITASSDKQIHAKYRLGSPYSKFITGSASIDDNRDTSDRPDGGSSKYHAEGTYACDIEGKTNGNDSCTNEDTVLIRDSSIKYGDGTIINNIINGRVNLLSSDFIPQYVHADYASAQSLRGGSFGMIANFPGVYDTSFDMAPTINFALTLKLIPHNIVVLITGDGNQGNQDKYLNKTISVMGQAQQLYNQSKQAGTASKNTKSIVSYVGNLNTKDAFLKALSDVPAGSLVISINGDGGTEGKSFSVSNNKTYFMGKKAEGANISINYLELMPVINRNLLSYADLGHNYFISSASNNNGLTNIQPINLLTINQNIVKAIEEYPEKPTLNRKIKSAVSDVISEF